MHNRKKFVLLSLIVSDFFLINASFLISFFLLVHLNYEIKSEIYAVKLLLFNASWLVSSVATKMYTKNTSGKIDLIFRSTWRMLLIHTTLFLGTLLIFQIFDKSFFISITTLLIVLFTMSRFFVTYVTEYLIKHADRNRRIAILGYNETGLKLANYFREQRNTFSFQGFFDKQENYMINAEGRIVSPIENCIDFAIENNIREIYSTILPHEDEEVSRLIDLADSHCVRVKFVSDTEIFTSNPDYKIEYLDSFPIITLRTEPLLQIFNRGKKRLFDIAFSLFVIVFFLSWLVPLIALLIKLESKGPVFFKQLRSGRNNQPFFCYKFRSMTVNNNSDQVQATKNDQRITRVGAFLRKTSLDEFPQFLNVLKGDMSIVGPRPHMLKHTEDYSKIISKYMVRHFLKPGITGWAQVNGYRGETESPFLMQKRVEHDIWYMENWSLMLDVRIIFMTVINIFKGEEKAY